MKIWITGYIGSGKSTIAKQFDNVFEFDGIEILLRNKGYNLNSISSKNFKEMTQKELNNLNNIIILILIILLILLKLIILEFGETRFIFYYLFFYFFFN